MKPARDPSKSMCEILDHCIDRNQEMKERLSAVQTDYDRISQERANALKRLEKCVVAKEELEKELYSKFVDVLNSKKEKIRQLKSNYANGDSLAGTSHTEQEPVKTGVKRAKKRSAPGNDGESDQEKSDADTTDEEASTLRKSTLGEPPGFLHSWWCVFWDLYCAAPERRENCDHSSEAKAFHDYGFVNSGYGVNGIAHNAAAPSPLGQMNPQDGMSGGQCHQGFFLLSCLQDTRVGQGAQGLFECHPIKLIGLVSG